MDAEASRGTQSLMEVKGPPIAVDVDADVGMDVATTVTMVVVATTGTIIHKMVFYVLSIIVFCCILS